jgi:hypothetical protein
MKNILNHHYCKHENQDNDMESNGCIMKYAFKYDPNQGFFFHFYVVGELVIVHKGLSQIWLQAIKVNNKS